MKFASTVLENPVRAVKRPKITFDQALQLAPYIDQVSLDRSVLKGLVNDIDKIRKNWFSFLKVDSNMGMIFDIIHKSLMKNPYGPDLDKHDLFPIRDK